MGGFELLPAGLEPTTAFILCLASFFTSGLTAAFGIGGGVALLALMSFLVPVASVIPVHGVVQLGSNTGRTFLQRQHVQLAPLALFLAGGMIGTLAGAQFVIRLDEMVLKSVLAVFIIAITWFKLPRLNKPTASMFGIGGALTGFVTMFVGATGPLVIAFMEKAFPARQQVVATHAAAMATQHLLKAAAFGVAGFAFSEWAGLILAMIGTGFIGTVIGTRMLNNMPETGFRRNFKWLMTMLALFLLWQAING